VDTIKQILGDQGEQSRSIVLFGETAVDGLVVVDELASELEREDCPSTLRDLVIWETSAGQLEESGLSVTGDIIAAIKKTGDILIVNHFEHLLMANVGDLTTIALDLFTLFDAAMSCKTFRFIANLHSSGDLAAIIPHLPEMRFWSSRFLVEQEHVGPVLRGYKHSKVDNVQHVVHTSGFEPISLFHAQSAVYEFKRYMLQTTGVKFSVDDDVIFMMHSLAESCESRVSLVKALANEPALDLASSPANTTKFTMLKVIRRVLQDPAGSYVAENRPTGRVMVHRRGDWTSGGVLFVKEE